MKVGDGLNIPIEIKKKCVSKFREGISVEKIYTDCYCTEGYTATFESFTRLLRKWRVKVDADDKLLEAGNLGYSYTPTRTTVQVNRHGQVVQAWVKSHTNDDLYLKLIEEVKKNTPHEHIEIIPIPEASKMLEINICDMHFGIADLDHYRPTLNEILILINKQRYDEINVIIGQDLIHNDNFQGTTTKGTVIQKINVPKAWNDAKTFWYNIIDLAVRQSNQTRLIYTVGNHDKNITWAFFQMLKERYQNLEIDDSLRERKCITYGTNFIGLTHGEFKKSKHSDLRSQFSVKFPMEFARSKVKEIHCSHLHTEWEKDEYGVMCRRLSSGNQDDDWSEGEGFIGANKRFMVFEWSLDKLSDIHYV
jgi:hypothetical protein